MAKSTDLPPGNVLLGVKSFGASPDFSAAEVKLQMTGSGGFTFVADRDVIQRTITRLSEVVSYLQSRTRTTTGHIAVHALDVVEMGVSPGSGGGTVIARIKTSSGIEHNFSIPTKTAVRAQLELQTAIKSAEEQASATRQ